ncbi:MAG: DUF4038 domain-containing protein [bacterium]|nr:DUF4038 domain-containing protein [bacterium]
MNGKSIMTSRLVFSLTILIALLATSLAGLSQDVHPWTPVELSFKAGADLKTPYIDGLPDGGEPYLKAVFKHESGETITLPGFWDGGSDWKVRFAPAKPGAWRYVTQSPDELLNGQTGEIVCSAWSDEQIDDNPTRRGFIHVNEKEPRPGRYFIYADGTPFLWIGDTWWNWTKRGIPLERFQTLADDRASKGFTVGQLFFAGLGWGKQSSMLNEDFTQPDVDHIHEVEAMIRYANQKGITVWVHGWWGGAHLKDHVGAEAIRRWTRYMVARLAAYNVIWVLAGEYNLDNYGGLGLDFWEDLGAMIAKEDPYDRAISAHPTPPGWGGGEGAPQWSTADVMHDESWLSYNQSQVGHGKWRNEMIPSVVSEAYAKQPAKPIVVTEPWYEFIKGNPTAEEIRFGAWSAMCSGAAGHSYGGGHVWKAHVPEAPAGKDSWPMEMGFETNTLDYPGARSIGYMAKFLKSIDWWELEPHPELVIDNSSRYCMAKPGLRYVAFLRWGGAVKLDLTGAPEISQLRYQWIDLGEEKIASEGTVQGGGVRAFHPPQDYPGIPGVKDYVLYVYP